MAGEPILIVDDNPANLKLARIVLESHGHMVRVAPDAEQAQKALESFTPRLILMDIQLPGMDGLELTRLLKANPATRAIVIVALTAYAMKGDEERARAAGCDGYIAKPINTKTLPLRVAELIAQGSARSPAASLPPSILVVDDNPTIRKMFRVTLEAHGYEVVEAACAADALARAAARAPDMILQDLLLPDMNGFELTHRLRALPGGDHIPIIALTGFASVLDQARALHIGFDAALVKPVEPSRLVEIIGRYLAPPSGAPADQKQGAHVLVVDDDLVQLKLTGLRLRRAGFRVTTAASGAEGLAQARASLPDLILSDVLMPSLDGFAFCLEVRRDPYLSGVPLVLASAHYREVADDELARRAGATGFVVRSAGFEAVLAAVVRGIGRRPPPAAAEPIERLKEDHAQRVVQQLDRQATTNASLMQQCALQGAQLSILGGVADALARSTDIDAMLGDVISSCLDAGGISKGALYRIDARGELVLHHTEGCSDEERARLVAFAGSALLEQVTAAGTALAIPSDSVDRGESQALLAGLRLASALIIPLMVNRRPVGVLFLGSKLAAVPGSLAVFGRTTGGYIGQALALSDAFARVNASEARYRALMACAGDAILVATPEGVILEANRQAAELLGRPSADLLGRTYVELLEPDRAAYVTEQHERLLAQGSARFDGVAVARPDGAEVFVDWSASLAETGNERFVFLIGRDITRRRWAEAALRHREEERAELLRREQAARQEAEQANRAKDEFMSTLSHELRTPLTSIVGWASMLQGVRGKKLDAATVERGLDVILRNAKLQAQLVEDIFDVARISTGILHLTLRDVEVVPLMRAGLEAIAPAAQAKGVRVDAEIDPAAGTISADPERVQQIVLNLLSNALKFTPRGGRIAVRVERREGSVRIRVSDTGQGIRADFLPFVFDRYSQADGSVTRAHGGLGLGLAIVRHLVELHAGTIAVESDGEGRGATFTVTFPAREAQGDPATPAPGAPAAPGAAAPLRLDGLQILVVEDDPDTQEMLASALAGSGARITAVSSVPEAIRALERGPPDVLVSDVSMPGADGHELIRFVRHLPEAAGGRTPAVALTARASAADARAARSAGFQVHVTKPVDPNALIAIVAELAGR